MTASHSTLNIQHLTFQPMRSPSRFLSRISIRLALFNLLVVFLPVAGMLFLGSYEQRLEQAQIDSMQRQARLVVSMMHSGATAPAALTTRASPLRSVRRMRLALPVREESRSVRRRRWRPTDA